MSSVLFVKEQDLSLELLLGVTGCLRLCLRVNSSVAWEAEGTFPHHKHDRHPSPVKGTLLL